MSRLLITDRRVTISSTAGRADLTVPVGVSVAELVDTIVGTLDDAATPGGEWVLQPLGQAALRADVGLAENGVLDGAVLHLRRRQFELPTLRFDDPAEAIASTVNSGRRWSSEHTRTALAAAAGVTAPLAAGLLAFGAASTRPLAIAAALVPLTAGIALRRSRRAIWLAVASAISGGLAVSGLAHLPAALGHVAIFAAAAGVIAGGLRAILGRSRILEALSVSGVVAAAATGSVAWRLLDAQQAASALAILLAATAPQLPRIAVLVAGVATDARRAEAQAGRAAQIVTAGWLSAALLLPPAGAAMARGGALGGITAALAGLLVLITSARHVGLADRLAGIVSGAGCLAVVALILAAGSSQARTLVGGLALVTLATCTWLVVSPRSVSALPAVRFVELCCAAAIGPVAVVSLGLVSWARPPWF
jgi:hypothetical protein